MLRLRQFAAVAALSVLACQGPSPITGNTPTVLSLTDNFVPVPRTVDSAEASRRKVALSGASAYATADTASSFFLAVRKTALKKKWFLSSYVKQVFPGSVGGYTLGTMVVTFKEQGGKLFVFNANDGISYSDVVAPEVIVEAYPIVTNEAFAASASSNDYVLIDPSAGLNHFLLVPDSVMDATADLQIDLSYVQNFKQLQDGVTFEEVFTGFVAGDRTRISGTLGMALRSYQESDGYTATDVPEQGEYYFRGAEQLIANSGGYTTSTAVKWQLSPGKPVQWVISPEVLEVAQEGRFAGVDIAGAFKRGVTNWNEAFGFEALTVRDATQDESFASDDVNYVIIERDPAAGYAFANWRSNPNTGEIRGASVFFSSMWFDYAEALFLADDDTGSSPAPASVPSNAKRPQGALRKIQDMKLQNKTHRSLTWKPAPSYKTCEYGPQGDAAYAKSLAASLAANVSLTKQQKVERFLTHVVLHEIGHTLGLRHNFKGSLNPPSSSVMEYVDDRDAVFVDKPQSYDVAAVRYLYGLSNALPTDAFCTDDSVGRDPDCQPYDTTSDPLNKLYIPQYQAAFLGDTSKEFEAGFDDAAAIFGYMVSGSTATIRAHATAELFKPIAVPATARDANDAEFKDFLHALVLYSVLGSPMSPSQQQYMLDQAAAALVNADGLRTYEMRRVLVEAIKADASNKGYATLLSVKTTLTQQAQAVGLDALERGLREDLLRRVDAAITTYFN